MRCCKTQVLFAQRRLCSFLYFYCPLVPFSHHSSINVFWLSGQHNQISLLHFVTLLLTSQKLRSSLSEKGELPGFGKNQPINNSASHLVMIWGSFCARMSDFTHLDSALRHQCIPQGVMSLYLNYKLYLKGGVPITLFKKAERQIILFKYLLHNINVSMTCRTLGVRYKNDPHEDSIPQIITV